jgi:hypothetical protein
MALTELQIKALKSKAIRYVVSNGRGLALEVMPTVVFLAIQIMKPYISFF